MDLKWLAEQLRRPGYSQAGLARYMSLDPAAITRMLKSRRAIKTTEVPLITAYLGAEPKTLDQVPTIGPAIDVRSVVTKDNPLLVYRSESVGRGPEMLLIIYKEVIAEAARPEGLKRAKRAFAFEQSTGEMSPVFEIRDILLVDPDRPARPIDNVLLVKSEDGDKISGLVRRLEALTPSSCTVRVYQPKPATVELKRADWQIWPIVGSYKA